MQNSRNDMFMSHDYEWIYKILHLSYLHPNEEHKSKNICSFQEWAQSSEDLWEFMICL